MTNPNDPAFSDDFKAEGYDENRKIWPETVGLTKREYFAAMAMPALIQVAKNGTEVVLIPKAAVNMADALIAALNKVPNE